MIETAKQIAIQATHEILAALLRKLPGPPIEVAFRTPGAAMPEWLRAQHPDRLRIIFQHQYSDLAVVSAGVNYPYFAVRMWFGGRDATLHVPFRNVIGFQVVGQLVVLIPTVGCRCCVNAMPVLLGPDMVAGLAGRGIEPRIAMTTCEGVELDRRAREAAREPGPEDPDQGGNVVRFRRPQ